MVRELCHLVVAAVHSGSDDHRFEALFFASGPARRSSFKGFFAGFKNRHGAIDVGANEVCIHYADKPFSITYARMPLLSALMEFLMTSIGYGVLDDTLSALMAKDMPNQKQVSGVANELSKKLYTYLGAHLPPAQEQRKSQSFLRFVTDNATDKDLSSMAIDDDTVMEFWLRFSGENKDEQGIDVKTYRSVFRMAVHLVSILRYAEDKFRMDGALPIGTDFETGEIDPSDLDAALADIEPDRSPLEDLADAISAGIKIINKREMETLEEVFHGDAAASLLTVSILRNAVFGTAQSGLVQALRQSKGRSLEQQISEVPADDYWVRLDQYRKLLDHIEQMLLASFHVLACAKNAAAATIAMALRPDIDVSSLIGKTDEPDWGDSNVVSLHANTALTQFFSRLSDEDASDIGQLAGAARKAFNGVSRQGFNDADIKRADSVAGFAALTSALISLRGALTKFLNQHTATIDWDHQLVIDTVDFQSQFTALYGGQNG